LTRLAHEPAALADLRDPRGDDPWRVLISGCLAGFPVGVDGTSYGMSLEGAPWLQSPKVHLIPTCPEHLGLGTPRTMPDLHGGDGFDVLDGRAKVLDEHGVDLTDALLRGAKVGLALALDRQVDWALLTDRSAACGSQVVSTGCRYEEPVHYRRGVGVFAAMLLRAGVPVVSQRDHRTMAELRARIEPGFSPPEGLVDHHEHPWVIEHLSGTGTR
jgi:uncharacterized protein YbbK (DUF523 family)